MQKCPLMCLYFVSDVSDRDPEEGAKTAPAVSPFCVAPSGPAPLHPDDEAVLVRDARHEAHGGGGL